MTTSLLALVLSALSVNSATAQSANESEGGAGISWLLENFSGPFEWETTDPDTGVEISGTGDCEAVFGGNFLRCVHKSPDGDEIGVGISGFHEAKQMYQWAYYGADGTAIMFGEGQRDPSTQTSWVEGRQKIDGVPEFTFRTVTRMVSDGEWSYKHFRVENDSLIEMFSATFLYPVD